MLRQQPQRTMQNVAKREPRIDAHRYQARIPALLPRPVANHNNNADFGMEMVCSGEFTPQICAYLDFCRRLTGSLALHGSSFVKPLEEDENALEFLLVQARGNIERAQLLLIASLGGGSSFKSVKDPEKPRPVKSKTAFRVLITDNPSPQQTNDNAKSAWEQWFVRAKKALPSTNAGDLIAVLREARLLPLFRAPCDEPLVAQYYDTLYQIEGKTKDVEEFIARVHDAVSVVRPEEKWTTAELKRLAEEGPKKLVVREAELLKEMANECEAWERQATKWLQDAPNPQVSFTLPQLSVFIQCGERSIADHVDLLKSLCKKQRDAQALVVEISHHLPKHGMRPVETATLAKLKRYRDALRKLKLKAEFDDQLGAIINAAEEWLSTAQNLHESNNTSAATMVTLEELRELLHKAKTLPVDFTEERSQLQRVLAQCENWQNRFRALWPAADAEEEQEDLRSIPPHVVDQLNGLLKENLPVIVPEERTLRTSMHTLNWSQRAFQMLSAPKATLPLVEFERLLEDLDLVVQSFDQPATTVKRTPKKTKRTLPTLEYEEEIRSVVQQSIEWLRCAKLVAEHPHYQLADSKRLTVQEFEDFLAQQPQVVVEPRELLLKVETKTNEFRMWVESTHRRLIEAGAVEDGEKPERKLLLSESELTALLKEAGEWGVETQELQVLQRINQQLREWKLQCAALSETVHEEVQQQLLYKKRKRKQTQERWELSEEDLLKLRERGEQLCVEVSLVDVETCMQATEEWKSLLQDPLAKYWNANQMEGLQQAPIGIFAEASASLLQFMRLINTDESFPEEKETSEWRDHELSTEAEDALEEIIRGMQDAEEQGLHLVGVDSLPVQAAAWLIQADIWLDRVKTEVLDATGGGGVTLMEVCQLVFQGLKLMVATSAEDNDLNSHDAFPEKVLDMYFHSSTPYSKRSKLVPAVAASTTTTTTAPSSPDLNPAVAAPVVPAATTEEHFDPWPIFKHIKECSSFEAEGGMHSSMQHNNVTGVLLSRLFGLTRAAQRYFAVRSLVLTTIPRIPRSERTPQMLKGFIDKAQEWTTTIHLQESPEEIKLKQDWAATEACEAEILRFTKQPLACTATVDVLEKLCNKADRLWVDASLVAQLKQTVKSCNNWILRAGEALDAPTMQTANLKRLISEGLEWNKTVNVSQMVQELKQVTDVTCMCRGPRVPNIMVSCTDCKEIFHRDCVREFYSTVCPVCAAMRAVSRCVGYGYAAVCRVAALELTEQEVQVDNAECRNALVDWMHEAREVLQLCKSMPEISLPKVPAMLETTFEVKAVCEAFVVLQWSFKLEKMRVKPTLQDLEYTLRTAPKIVPVVALAGLQAICTRGRVLTDWCAQIWALPINTPSSVVLQRCEEAVQQFRYLPLDMASTQREVQACIDDKANRHCICRKFDKGTMMLNCAKCDLWFHGSCVGKADADAATSGDFYCPACARKS